MIKLTFKDNCVKNFVDIYKDMTSQFPPEELKTFDEFKTKLSGGNYKLFIIADSNIDIGYIIFSEYNKSIWIDYIAIFKQFHSKGYGSAIFNQMKTDFKDIKGCFLEVEKPNQKDINTQRRIRFYKNLGAEKLPLEYLYPNQNGFLPMDLYYMPFGENKVSEKENTFKTIKHVFNNMHCELLHKDEVYDKICVLSKFN